MCKTKKNIINAAQWITLLNFVNKFCYGLHIFHRNVDKLVRKITGLPNIN